MDSHFMVLWLQNIKVRYLASRGSKRLGIARPASLLALLFTTLFSLNTLAGDPPIFSPKKDIAVRGTDVVAYFDLARGAPAVKGRSEFSTQWNGAVWHFSSAKNLEKFKQKPEAYAPQYGGYCAFAVSHGFTKPTDPDAWYIEKGKLYLNYSPRVQKKWLKDVPGNIVKADNNWPKVLKLGFRVSQARIL